jgi:hypothetical protein
MRKIPTILGLLLVIALVGTIVFVERMLRAPSGASGSTEITNARFTNISDTSFTTSWTTDTPTTGTILVSATGKNNQIYYDERDQTGKLGKYTSHSVTVRDGKPGTEYSIKLMSNGSQHLLDGKPYIVHTSETLTANTNGLEPAYGTIRDTNGLAADGALVYLTIEGGQELSALTKPSGLWLIPLNQMRTEDLTSFLPPLERMDETIIVRFNGQEVSATTDTLNDAPVPDMTMGQTYDFRRQQAKTTGNSPLALRPSAAPTNTALPVGGTVLGETATRTYSVSLTAPVEGAAIPSTLPLISGTGIPNTFIGISIGITQPVSGSVRVNPNGTWNFTPTKNIPPGKQSVTISGVNNTGKTVAITHAFEILKSGTQVLGDATPSGTLTTTPPVIGTPSATPLEVPVSTLSGEPPPTSGNELPTILLLLLGVGLLAGGAAALVW